MDESDSDKMEHLTEGVQSITIDERGELDNAGAITVGEVQGKVKGKRTEEGTRKGKGKGKGKQTLKDNLEEGYIYCISNPCYQADIYKIGFSLRDPKIRVGELFNTAVPMPFKLEFAKKVKSPRREEKEIHATLIRDRVNQRREFFRHPLDKIKKLFDGVAGNWYNDDSNNSQIGSPNNNHNIVEQAAADVPSPLKPPNRMIKSVFVHGQKAKHSINANNWVATYNSEAESYNTLQEFVIAH
jgi:T5orf172 domain